MRVRGMVTEDIEERSAYSHIWVGMLPCRGTPVCCQLHRPLRPAWRQKLVAAVDVVVAAVAVDVAVAGAVVDAVVGAETAAAAAAAAVAVATWPAASVEGHCASSHYSLPWWEACQRLHEPMEDHLEQQRAGQHSCQ